MALNNFCTQTTVQTDGRAGTSLPLHSASEQHRLACPSWRPDGGVEGWYPPRGVQQDPETHQVGTWRIEPLGWCLTILPVTVRRVPPTSHEQLQSQDTSGAAEPGEADHMSHILPGSWTSGSKSSDLV